jgi:hypothetical protein
MVDISMRRQLVSLMLGEQWQELMVFVWDKFSQAFYFLSGFLGSHVDLSKGTGKELVRLDLGVGDEAGS